jgi:hypothetical protein
MRFSINYYFYKILKINYNEDYNGIPKGPKSLRVTIGSSDRFL